MALKYVGQILDFVILCFIAFSISVAYKIFRQKKGNPKAAKIHVMRHYFCYITALSVNTFLL